MNEFAIMKKPNNKSLTNKNTFLENKIKKDKRKKKWKPYKYLSYEEKKKLENKEALRDKKKQVINFNCQEIRNNKKLLKNLEINKKALDHVIKPATPHNTSQYLTTNFSQGRYEKIPSLSPSDAEDSNAENGLVDYFNEADNYCIPGGSMQGIEGLNIDMINVGIEKHSDSKDETRSKDENAQLEKYAAIIAEQERMIALLTERLNQHKEDKG